MSTTTKENLQEIELVMLHKKEEVFSGSLKDLSERIEESRTVDRVNFFNTKGSLIMSMNYRDFERIVGDQFL